jgi:hypothetical protein
LKRNEDYLRCCASHGHGKMAALFKDFGDVRDDDFKSWWRHTGEDLFSEIRLQTLEIVERHPLYITVYVPLTMKNGSIQKRFKRLLNEVRPQKKGGKITGNSYARYPLAAKAVPKALETALRVYDVWKVHRKKDRRDKNGWTLWQIGEAANASDTQKTQPSDTPAVITDKRMTMAVAVSRYIVTAERYIRNVGKGRFPEK